MQDAASEQLVVVPNIAYKPNQHLRRVALFNPDTTSYTFPEQPIPAAIDGLFRRKLALGHANDVLWLGDSVMEGYGQTQDSRYMTLVTNKMRRVWQSPSIIGGEGYVPWFYQVAVGMTDRWVDVVGTSGDEGYGLGRRSGHLFGTDAGELTFVGTGFKLFYATADATTTQTYTIDGGAPVSLPPTTGPNDPTTVKVVGLSDGTHTLRVSGVTGNMWAQGAFVYRGDDSDTAPVIRMWDAAKGGMTVGNLLDNWDLWANTLPLVNPSLVVIALGANDQVNDTPQGFQNKYETLVNKINEKLGYKPSYLLIGTHQSSGTMTAEKWQGYLNAVRQTALATGAAFLDMVDFVGPLVAAGGMFNSDDTTHLSVAGHNLYAQIIELMIIGSPRQQGLTARAVYKTVETIRNNDAVPSNDPHLHMAVEPNAVYQVEALLVYTGQQTADFKVQWSVPVGATMDWNGGMMSVGAASSTQSWNSLGLNETQSTVGGALTSRSFGRPVGILRTVAGGYFTMQWSQATQEVSDLTLLAYSMLKLTRIN